MVATQPAAQKPRTFFGHPPMLANLFTVEMWERFSFYGMQALALYYLYHSIEDGGLGIPEKQQLVLWERTVQPFISWRSSAVFWATAS